MFIQYLIDSFIAGSIGLKFSMIIFILVLGGLLTWFVFALFGLENLRKNKVKLFQIVAQEELDTFDKLAEYKVFDKGEKVYFLDKGIAVRDSIEIRIVQYKSINIEECVRVLHNYLKAKKLASSIKIPLFTSRKIKYVFGGQKLKIFMPIEDEKKRVVVENLIKLLQG